MVQNILIGLKQRKYVYKLPCPIPSQPVQFSPQQLPTHKHNTMRTLASKNRNIASQYSEFRNSRKKSEKERPDKVKLCIRNDLDLGIDSPRVVRRQLSHGKVAGQMSLVAVCSIFDGENLEKDGLNKRWTGGWNKLGSKNGSKNGIKNGRNNKTRKNNREKVKYNSNGQSSNGKSSSSDIKSLTKKALQQKNTKESNNASSCQSISSFRRKFCCF